MEALIWRDVQMLWPNPAALTRIEQLAEDPIPHGLAKDGQQPREKMQRLLHFLGEDSFEAAWKDLPWRKIITQTRVRLTQTFGDLDPEFHRERIPQIDNAIMAATLSRRLIMSGLHIGLGPVDTQVGDKLFFLKGGKTPFVLRATSAEPTLNGSKYELVGDCYIQDCMDGNGSRHETGDRRAITLL
jgi:hypothetical protein